MMATTSPKSIGEILKDFTKENKKAAILYVMFCMATPITQVLLPYYYGKITESVAKNPRKKAIIANKTNIAMVCGLWGISIALYAGLNWLDRIYVPKLQSYVRLKLVQQILESHSEKVIDPEIGKFIAEILKLPFVIRDMFHQIRAFIVPTILTIIFALGFFYFADWKIGGLATLAIGVIFTVLYFFLKDCLLTSSTLDGKYEKMFEKISDILSNMMNVFSSNTLTKELIRLEKEQMKYNIHYRSTFECTTKFKTIFTVCYLFLFIIVCGASLWLYSKGQMELSTFTSTVMVTLFLIQQMAGVGGEIREFVHHIGVLNNTQKSIDKRESYRPKVRPPSVEKFSLSRAGILFGNIGCRFGDKHALKDIHLRVNPEEKIVFVGKIGSGKTTLCQLLMKLHPYTGTIRINGKDASHIDTSQLRQQIAYVPQNPRLFNRSIYDNIVYGNEHIPLSKVQELAKQFSFDADLLRKAGKNGSALSGGQRQIVYLMRCILQDRPIVILDEPTASLDANSKKTVVDLVKRLVEGKTALMITHDPILLQLANKIVEMKDGEIISIKDEKHSELKTNGEKETDNTNFEIL